MLPFCLKCKINTKNVDQKVIKTKNGRTVLSSKCAICSKSQDLRKNKKQKEC